MIPRPVGIGICVVVGLALLVLIVVGTRRLSRSGADLVPSLPPLPATPFGGEPTPGTYVVTTLAGDWLARVGAHGLGQRARATARVGDSGVLLERAGAQDLFLPAASIEGAELTTGMAGKFTGRDWIVVVTWAVPAGPGAGSAIRLDTGFMPDRHADAQPLRDAVRTLAGDSGPATDPKEAR